MCVSQHRSCSTWNLPVSSKFSVNNSPFSRAIVSKNERRGGGSSPSWTSSLSKSIELPFRRQGVPVLKRPTSNPKERMPSLKLDEVSAMRPPGLDCSPTCRSPRKKVPAVITTDIAGISSPRSVVTPTAMPRSTKSVAAVPCSKRRFGVFSKIAFSRN